MAECGFVLMLRIRFMLFFNFNIKICTIFKVFGSSKKRLLG